MMPSQLSLELHSPEPAPQRAIRQFLNDPDAIARFLAKIERGEPDSCWLWTGTLNADGYGNFRYNGADRWRSYGAHRLALALATSTVPTSRMLACHHCDAPACCNPRHLYWGTNKSNMRDAMTRGQWVHYHLARREAPSP